MASPDTSPDLQPFQYPPLPSPETQVRLLKLQAGSGNDPIKCKLLIVNRADLSDFEAISYTWGMSFHVPNALSPSIQLGKDSF